MPHFDIAGQIPEVAREFQLACPDMVQTNPHGLIHKTFEVNIQGQNFIFQRIHPVFGEAELFNMAVAAAHLRRYGVPAPQVWRTKEEIPFCRYGDAYWRVMEKLPGEIYQTVRSPGQIQALGEMLGRFQMVMATMPGQLRSGQRKLHDTPAIITRARQVFQRYQSDSKYAPVQALIFELISAITPLLLPENSPQGIVHGDPKITNFLFTGETEISGVLDLDMVSYNSGLVDIGDALRSWCGQREDDPNNTFNLNSATAAVGGFNMAVDHDRRITTKSALRAAKLITLELALRFLVDYFEESYFRWDPNRYQSAWEHHLARTKSMAHLAASIPI
jgi:Ser/Thr protein kinase RdoA (MazF antagonist)